MAANQVDFKILPSDQFSVYSPQTRSDKVITYFTLLSKLRGDILSVGQEDDPNNIVSAFYINTGNVQTLHLVKADGSEVTASNSFAGTVTSVNMSVPTGFSISGNPITTSGTLAVGFASGYSLPTNAIQTTWTTAYNRSLTSAAVTGTSTKTLTLNQQNGGTITASWSDIDTGLTSVGLTMPAAFSVANSPLTANGTLAVTAAGLSSQYIRGDGQLANFPTPSGGGSSVNYYLNGSVNQGVFGGVTYYELSKTPISGAGTNFTRTSASGDGYVASFITDANDPDQINIPGGNWNLEFYFDSSSSGGSPAFYGELYKVSTLNVFTLIASGSANSEAITGGTSVDQYYTSIAVPQTALLATDRLAVRVYVIVSGRNITLHTENSNFSEVITTFSTGLNSLNGLSDQVQYFAVGTSGTDFAISSSVDTHTFNLPTASATNRGALSSADWSTFSGKQNAITLTTTGTTGAATLIGATLNIPNYADQFVGTVTSVNMSVPTGFAISGNPITTSGTLAVAFAAGYSLPTNTSQTNWNTAYNDSITAFAYNTSTGVLTLTQQDAGTLTATVTLQPFTTSNLAEGTNLYYTDARARLALSAGTGISYSTTTGVITNSAPDQTVVLTASTGISVTGTYPSFTITNTSTSSGGTVTSIATTAPITGGTITTTGTIGITQSGAAADGYLSSTDWNTFNNKQNALTNPVTGTGTTNYVPKWTSASAIGNSQIFDDGTNVGIGTALPGTKLDVAGQIRSYAATGQIYSYSTTSSNTAIVFAGWTSGNGMQMGYLPDTAQGYIENTYPITGGQVYGDIYFRQNISGTMVTRMTIRADGGNVGIGTTTPSAKLQIGNGTSNVQSLVASFSADGGNAILSALSLVNSRAAADGNGTAIDFHNSNTYSSTGRIASVQDSGTNASLRFSVYNSTDNALVEKVRLTAAGNVGIGTTAPGNYKLAVSSSDYRVVSLNSTYGQMNMDFANSGVYFASIGSGNSQSSDAGITASDFGIGTMGSATNKIIFATGTGYATRMAILPSGNVGIGNTGPSEKLHVTGNIRVTGAYYDSGNSAGTSGQILSSTATGTSWIAAPSGGITGSGTTNYVPKWTSASAIGDSAIYDNAGNIGIGTTSPSYKLDVNGGSDNVVARFYNSSNVATVVYIGDTGNSDYSDLVLQSNSGTGEIFKSGTGYTSWGGALALNIYNSNGAIAFHPNNTANAMFIATNSNVGINTTAPGQKLQVDGNLLVNAGTSAAAYRDIMMGGIGGWATGESHGIDTVYNTAASPTTFSRIESHFDGTNGKMRFRNLFNASAPRTDILMTIQGDGNVGIGTDSPSTKLQVVGTSTFNAQTATYGGTVQSVLIDGNGGNAALTINATSDYAYLNFAQAATTKFEIGVEGAATNKGSLYINHNIQQGSTGAAVFIKKSDGNVGIGTTGPSYKLDINGVTRFQDIVRFKNDAWNLSDDGKNRFYFTPNGRTYFGSFNGYEWRNAADGAIAVITDAGNVGIGTTAPAEKLQVIGNIGVGNGTYNGGVYVNSSTSAVDTNWGFDFSKGAGDDYSTRVKFYPGASSARKLGFYDARNSAWLGYFDGNANSNLNFIFNSGGNVGIGTVAPTRLLSLNTAVNTYMSFNEAGTEKWVIGTDSTGGNQFLIYDAVAGLTRMAVKATGNVGIGTTAPAEKLAVVGNIRSAGDVIASVGLGYGNYISMRHDDVNGYITITRTVYAGHLILQPYGNVGINTTSPATKFEVYGGHSDTTARLYSIGNGSGSDASLDMWASEPGVTYDGSGIGNNVNGHPYYGRRNAGLPQSYIRFYNGGILLNTGSTTASQTVTVLASGNVGIGTTAPGAKLNVAGNLGAVVGAGGSAIRLTNTDTGNYSSISAGVVGVTNDGIQFSTDGTSRMIITGDGNVGIGTTSPSIPRGSGFRPMLHVYNNSSGTNPSVVVSCEDNQMAGYIAGDNAGTSDIGWGFNAYYQGAGNNFFNIRIGDNGTWTDRFTIDRAGLVGIGTTNPLSLLHVTGDTRITSGSLGVGVAPNATDGRIDASNDIVAFSSSDLRLKENIKPIENALEKVKSLTGVEFDWKPELKHAHGYEGHDTGVIAQEVQEVMPTAIRTNDTGYLAVRYEKLIGLLIEGMKEQQLQIDELKSKLK